MDREALGVHDIMPLCYFEKTVSRILPLKFSVYIASDIALNGVFLFVAAHRSLPKIYSFERCSLNQVNLSSIWKKNKE